MDNMIETREEPEKVILVGINTNQKNNDIRSSLDELEELSNTAGAVKVGEIIQARENPHPGTYLGKGKIEELKGLVEYTGADSVICDDELSPAQIRNLSDILGVKVIDRTVLILDIFAQHARTSEGALQVELAQLNYNSSHLTGSYSHMSRLGGGIGTRGPGEQKIEVDRRVIRNKISQIKKELEKTDKNRELVRRKRSESTIPVVAIVGYTNAGKSTLLNHLTNAGVLSEDKLFATLDPTTRKYTFEDGDELLFSDTVGFVRKLPHHLINAFKSTLQEAGYADLILIVCDSTSPDLQSHLDTVYSTLEELKISCDNSITVFNKIDRLNELSETPVLKDVRASKTVKISAKTGEGIDELLEEIRIKLKDRNFLVEKTFPYSEASMISFIRENGRIVSEEYVEDGIKIKGYVPERYAYKFKS
ncbi:MAG: GTPase HflX [Lachnospiraceae bacterium]|nr:GTPase HflX [Lachnospiraceae bacterium]